MTKIIFVSTSSILRRNILPKQNLFISQLSGFVLLISSYNLGLQSRILKFFLNFYSKILSNWNSEYPSFILIADEFCEDYPHNLMPTPGYWIECSRQKITLPTPHTIWDESDSEHEDIRAGSSSDAYLDRECSDLYEDDEDSEATPRWARKETECCVWIVVINSTP